MSKISEYFQEFGSLYYRVLQPYLIINQLFPIYIIHRIVKKKTHKTASPCVHAILTYIHNVHVDIQKIYTRLGPSSNTFYSLFWIFCVVKSDKAAELFTFCILNIFIYYSGTITGPEEKSIIDNKFPHVFSTFHI